MKILHFFLLTTLISCFIASCSNTDLVEDTTIFPLPEPFFAVMIDSIYWEAENISPYHYSDYSQILHLT